MRPTELIGRFAAGPGLVRELVGGMSREEVVARPVAGRWSTLEVVAHIADFEVIAVDRLTVIIAEEDPVLPGRDEKKYAARLGYHERDLEEQLKLVELSRSHVVRVFGTVGDECWSRRGVAFGGGGDDVDAGVGAGDEAPGAPLAVYSGEAEGAGGG